MPRSLATLRTQAAHKQQFRCFYCNFPMWDGSPHNFISVYGLTVKQARLLRCTAEHLHPKSEGGKNTAANIVAACLYCNQYRHKSPKPMDPARYKKHVSQRMQRGKWLAAILQGVHTALQPTRQYAENPYDARKLG